MDTGMKCSALQLPMNQYRQEPGKQPIQYLFFPTSTYKGKQMHLHTFHDYECDTPANDKVVEKLHMGKNIAHIKQKEISNSN
jgi:hypothetical protein